MTLPGQFIARLKRDIKDERDIVEQLKSGDLRIRHRLHGKDWEDVTAQEIVRRESVIATYQEIVGRQDRGSPPIRKTTRCPKCGGRDIDVVPSPNFPSGWELTCRACGHRGDGSAPGTNDGGAK